MVEIITDFYSRGKHFLVVKVNSNVHVMENADFKNMFGTSKRIKKNTRKLIAG